MHKKDMALDNLQWLMYHKIEPKQIMIIFNIYV